jgi:thioredoxin reductase (NADPH)
VFEDLPPIGYEAYAIALVVVWIAYAWIRRRAERIATVQQADTLDHEPPSLHPIIDPKTCVGCGACVNACPEGRIIGMIGDKAHLIDPASCIGHGACKTVCPVGAIDLVFGSARRGIDIPIVSASFESNVPGLYIAGELGGMGLIANAIEQGRQAMEVIAKRSDLGQAGQHDVIIIGGGPAGISASLSAKQKGLRALTLEQSTLGGTVAHYPRGKLVMTRPAMLPLYGKIRLHRVRKERLLALWQAVLAKTGLDIREGVRVEKITPTAKGFEVATTAGTARASTVLLATGRRGSPRKLGVPGEELPKVVYSLDEPTQYRGQHVLVVGGGDSALEAAIELARYPTASVTLSHRGETFERAKTRNRDRLAEAEQADRLNVLRSSTVQEIEAATVTIESGGRRRRVPNDAVIICAGGMLPTALLADLGVRVETKFGTA